MGRQRLGAPARQPTWEKLFRKADAPPYPGKEILLGANGDAVRAIQAKIDAHVDGEFGPKTDEALKAWQTANALKPDGRVGPKTWAKMFDWFPLRRPPGRGIDDS